MTEIIFTV